MNRRWMALLALALLPSCLWANSNEPEIPEEPVFIDGFESGTSDQWTDSEGGHKIRWEPEQVSVTTSESGQATVNVLFRARQALPASVLWVNPGIDDLVSVSPSSFPALSAGTEVPVTITIRPEGVGEWDGTIHLRQADGPPRTLAKPLPVVIVANEGDGLPPEPDPDVNNATLEGVDSNGDGIRDDVERFIALEWADPNVQQALRQFALSLPSAYSPNRWQESLLSSHSARGCVTHILGPEASGIARGDLLAMQHNTVERAEAFLDFYEDPAISAAREELTTWSIDGIECSWIGGAQ